MFWKALRWGGTAAVVIVVIIAALAGGADSAEPTSQPAAAQPAGPTKFNF